MNFTEVKTGMDNRAVAGNAGELPAGYHERRKNFTGQDLFEQLVPNKKETFFFRMNGDTMLFAGIMDEDILIVDRSERNINDKMVIAFYKGEMVVRRVEKIANKIILISGNKTLVKEPVQEDADFEIWGVITYVIHSFCGTRNA